MNPDTKQADETTRLEEFNNLIKQAAAAINAMQLQDAENNLQQAQDCLIPGRHERELSYIYHLRGRMLGRKTKYTDALQQYQAALEIRKQINDPELIGQSLHGIGSIFQLQDKFTEALQCFDEAQRLAEIAGSTNSMLACLQNKSVIFLNTGRYKEAVSAAQQVAEHHHITGNALHEARAWMNIAGMAFEAGSDDVALAYLLKALRVIEPLNDMPAVGRAYFNTGLIYFNRRQFDEALRHYQKAATIQEQLQNINELLLIYAHMGSLYAALNNATEAFNYLEKAEKLATPSISPNTTGLIYANKAEVYCALGNFEPAITFGFKALQLYEGINLAEASATALCQLGKYYLHLKDYDTARNFLNKALTRAQQLNLAPVLSETYNQFYMLEEACGSFKEALDCHRQHIHYRDITMSEKAANNIAMLQIQFDSEKKEHEIALLKKEKQDAMMYERLRISRDLHDDMGATLSSISIISEAAKQRINQNNIDGALALLSRISDDAREMVSDVSDMVWMINPQNDSMLKLLERLQTGATTVLQSKNILLSFRYDSGLQDINAGMETRKNIYLLVKEAVNNAAKYAACNNVVIKFNLSNNNMTVEIADDGIGFNPAAALNGNGLKNMRQRANALKGTITISSAPGQGSSIILACPLL